MPALLRLALAPLFVTLTLAATAQAATLNLAPHRAVYTLSLSRSDGAVRVTNVEGRLELEATDACDGWIIQQRAVMSVERSRGAGTNQAWTYNTWEAKDGLSFDFFLSRAEDGKEVERTRGKATLDGAGKGGTVSMRDPARGSYPLADGTVFPTAHTRAVLADAEAGEHVIWTELFDGTEGHQTYGLSTVVGESLEAGERSSKSGGPRLDSPLLTGGPSWTLRLAFFPPGDDAAESRHEQTIWLHQNGVMEAFLLDYHEFVIAGRLEELEALPAPDC